MARAIDRCDLMIKVLRVPGVQGNRLQDLQPNRSCETTHNMVFHLCNRVTFIRSKIFFKWIRTHYSPFNGGSVCGFRLPEKRSLRSLYPLHHGVSGVHRIFLVLHNSGVTRFQPQPQPQNATTPSTLKHSGLAMNYLTEICFTLQLDDG